MFPFDLDDLEEEIAEEIQNQDIPTDYEIDFTTGKLTGRILTGIDAIVQWAKIILGTDRYYFTQYSWEHGSELSTLIGQGESRDYIETEAEKMITDALIVSDYIESVDDFEIKTDGDTLTAKFTILTSFGDSEVEIDV